MASALDCLAQSPLEDAKAQLQADLSGRWRLNPEKSENLRDKIQRAGEEGSAAPPGGGGGGWRGGAGRGGRGGGGRGRGNPGEAPPRARREAPPDIEALLAGPSELAITHTESVVTIMEKDGRLRVLKLDAPPHAREAGAAQVTSRWNGQQLVVETVRSGSPKVTETFTLDKERSQLTIAIRLEGGRTVSVRRLYERQPDDRFEPRSLD
jgi:hypothetical protein